MRTILVPLDGSSLAEEALPYATALARRTGARLILVRAALARTFPGTDPGPQQLNATERAESELRAVAERLRADGIEAEPHVYYDDAATAILDAASRQRAELIVMSTHGRSGLGRWIYGSVADKVLHRAAVPVVLVPRLAAPYSGGAFKSQVLVPLDGSDLAEEALAPARAFAGAFDAELVLLEVVQPPCYPLYGDGYAYVPFDEEAMLTGARRYLEAVAERLRGEGCKVRTLAVVGQPASDIAAVAHEQGVDLIAMATHGRGGLARLVLGSVATGTLQRVAVPLLLVRPGAMQQPAPTSPTTLVAMEPDGETVTVTLAPCERALVREVLDLLVGRSGRGEHVDRPLRQLLEKVGRAGEERAGVAEAAVGSR